MLMDVSDGQQNSLLLFFPALSPILPPRSHFLAILRFEPH